MAPVSADGPIDAPEVAAPLTRAARRARDEALLREPVLSPLATVPRPIVAAASLVLAALLALASAVDHAVLAAGLAWLGLILAWGWPALLGSPSRMGSSIAIAVAGVLAPTAAAVATQAPYLRYVPVAVAVAFVVMFLHQLLRRDGRPRLVESLGVCALGIGVCTIGAAFEPLPRTAQGSGVAVAAFVGAGLSAVADLGCSRAVLRPWLWPASTVLGAVGGVSAALVGGDLRWWAGALVGALCGAIAYAVRRVLLVLPPITAIRSQLTTAAAGLLVLGVVAATVARLLPL